MGKRAGIFLLFCSLTLFSCQRGVVYSHSVAINPAGWKSDDFISFEFSVEDTIHWYNIDLHIRNDGRYEWSNLFLFIKTYAPTGEFIRDTIECTLANLSGEWTGRGIGGQYQRTLPYKTQVVFPYSGKYLIEIEHGMRTDPLQYITDLGLTIKAD